MKFEKVMPGKYRAQLQGDTYIWISRQAPRWWWWFIGGSNGYREIWADNNGPFASPQRAIADAVAKYKEHTKAKIVWYLNRPTHMGLVERPALWRLEAVIEGSERDKMLAAGRTLNDAGEWVEIPGEWRRFPDRESAEAWIAEAQRQRD